MSVAPVDNPETLLQEVLEAGLAAVRPKDVLPAYFPKPPTGRLIVVGAGKAAAAMAQTCEQYYQEHHPDVSLSGIVITRYGHAVSTQSIEVIEAAHPVPDEAGVNGTQRLLNKLEGLTEDDLVLCLISGGGSALLTSPLELTLSDQAAVTQALLHSGADIGEMNVVRKHLSKVKGGRLAEVAFPAKVVSLLISDVPGDDPSSIASGPTVPDTSTFADALEIFERYELDQPAAKQVLTKGISGELADTPDGDAPCFANAETHIVATAQGMLEAAANTFRQHGITPLILTNSLTGEAKDVAKVHASLARQVREHSQPLARPCALLSGGETGVTIRQTDTEKTGRGGRNCEFLLALAIELAGLPDTYALAADSDGIDGIGDAAGALISPDSLPFGLREARDYLTRHDAYTYFERLGTLIKTGPTHTNVNDLRVVLVL